MDINYLCVNFSQYGWTDLGDLHSGQPDWWKAQPFFKLSFEFHLKMSAFGINATVLISRLINLVCSCNFKLNTEHSR